MFLYTHNSFGKILISKRAINRVALNSCMDCYGITKVKKVKSYFLDNEISFVIKLNVKYGVSIPAVIEAVKSNLKYKVEKYSTMVVTDSLILVVGIND